MQNLFYLGEFAYVLILTVYAFLKFNFIWIFELTYVLAVKNSAFFKFHITKKKLKNPILLHIDKHLFKTLPANILSKPLRNIPYLPQPPTQSHKIPINSRSHKTVPKPVTRINPRTTRHKVRTATSICPIARLLHNAPTLRLPPLARGNWWTVHKLTVISKWSPLAPALCNYRILCRFCWGL
jgi:hypothetical protein